MLRLVRPLLASLLSLAGGSGLAHAYDHRVDPAVMRRAEITIDFTPEYPTGQPCRTADALDRNVADRAARIRFGDDLVPGGVRPAATRRGRWSPRPGPTTNSCRSRLHWAWVADNGDLITRAGKGHVPACPLPSDQQLVPGGRLQAAGMAGGQFGSADGLQ